MQAVTLWTPGAMDEHPLLDHPENNDANAEASLDLKRACAIMALCNDATLVVDNGDGDRDANSVTGASQKGNGPQDHIGDPTEVRPGNFNDENADAILNAPRRVHRLYRA